eukprot:3244892-Pyramimonas_sp.AAC.1
MTTGGFKAPPRPSLGHAQEGALPIEQRGLGTGRAMYEQTAAFMLQESEIRTTGEDTNALPEPINTKWYADWAVERDRATVEEMNAFMVNWGPLTMNLTRSQFIVHQGGSEGRWAQKRMLFQPQPRGALKTLAL